MDYIAIQQQKRVLEHEVFRSIKEFEKVTSALVDRINLGRVEGVKGITSASIDLKEGYNGS